MTDEIIFEILNLQKTEIKNVNSVLRKLKKLLYAEDSNYGVVLFRTVKLYNSTEFYQCKPGVLTKLDKLSKLLSETDRSFTFYYILFAKMEFLFHHVFFKEVADSFLKHNAQLLEKQHNDSSGIVILKNQLKLLFLKALAFKNKPNQSIIEKNWHSIYSLDFGQNEFLKRLCWLDILVFNEDLAAAEEYKDWLVENVQYYEDFQNYLYYVLGEMYRKLSDTRLALDYYYKSSFCTSTIQSQIYYLKCSIQYVKILEELGMFDKIVEYGEMFYQNQPNKLYVDINLFRLEFNFIYGNALKKQSCFEKAYDILKSSVDGDSSYSLNRTNLFDEVFYYAFEKAKKQKELEFAKRFNQSRRLSQSRFEFTSHSIEDIESMLDNCFVKVDTELGKNDFEKANEIIQSYSQLMRANIVLDDNILRSLEEETFFLEKYVSCNYSDLKYNILLENVDEVLYSDYVKLPHGVLVKLFRLCLEYFVSSLISSFSIDFSSDEELVCIDFSFSLKKDSEYKYLDFRQLNNRIEKYVNELCKNFPEIEVELKLTDAFSDIPTNLFNTQIQIKI